MQNSNLINQIRIVNFLTTLVTVGLLMDIPSMYALYLPVIQYVESVRVEGRPGVCVDF